MLTVICGLPATGKTTISTAPARATRASYSRVDTVESTIVRTTTLRHPLRPVGYAVAYSVAAEQLRLGLDVIVECVRRECEPWERDHLVLDTAVVEVDTAVPTIRRAQTAHTGR